MQFAWTFQLGSPPSAWLFWDREMHEAASHTFGAAPSSPDDLIARNRMAKILERRAHNLADTSHEGTA